jgi:hypothetical protein
MLDRHRSRERRGPTGSGLIPLCGSWASRSSPCSDTMSRLGIKIIADQTSAAPPRPPAVLLPPRATVPGAGSGARLGIPAIARLPFWARFNPAAAERGNFGQFWFVGGLTRLRRGRSLRQRHGGRAYGKRTGGWGVHGVMQRQARASQSPESSPRERHVSWEASSGQSEDAEHLGQPVTELASACRGETSDRPIRAPARRTAGARSRSCRANGPGLARASKRRLARGARSTRSRPGSARPCRLLEKRRFREEVAQRTAPG